MRAIALGRQVAAAAAAGAVVTAGQPSASARDAGRVQVAESTSRRQLRDQDWLVTDFTDKEAIIFKPYAADEVDAVCSEMKRAMGLACEDEDGHHASGYVTPARSETSSTTQGEDANLVIEQVDLRSTDSTAVASAGGSVLAAFGNDAHMLADVVRVTNKLLRRPGVQVEVARCMIEDPEVRDIVMQHVSQQDLDSYLAAVGVHAPGLLPAPDQNNSNNSEDAQPSPFLMAIQHALQGVKGLVQGFVGKCNNLANTLATRLGFKAPEPQAQAGTDEPKSQRSGGGRGEQFMKALMVMLVVGVGLLVLRRQLLFRVVRRA